ncbi:subtilisin-like protease SBT5.3 [Selaginella moellendorffii]|uniref:subtilisin-like protease SBT5.3 n=1 Tax=Selaginella moellendorffii TaxID=88036 RepID=UPI000D1C4E08|nr:subtilisin-like protease SBT5.3 [Selaginella moellendorffii]|eukprot:XP_024526543.1 subtilisin-like protease SBT5.3 [Selaginella moellendorffii]
MWILQQLFHRSRACLQESEALIGLTCCKTATPGVVKVFPNRMLQLQTTHSWDFVGTPNVTVPSKNESKTLPAAADVIVGVLDTGVWPESKSFSDAGMSEVPARWKGTFQAHLFQKKIYNVFIRKLIGARNYLTDGEFKNARDDAGHGTHTTSTIGGALVPQVSEFGLGAGTARGGFPGARVAMYRVCSEAGCASDAILAAFDDAIDDGVDILSLSLGGLPLAYDEDPIAIGSFHAIERKILVSCAGGNSGPAASSVSNGAPWILTVAASTIDRHFSVDIKLGNDKTLQVRKNSLFLCLVTVLDPAKVKGKIIVCEFDPLVIPTIILLKSLNNWGAAGVILGNDVIADIVRYFPLPGAFIKKAALKDLLAYTSSRYIYVPHPSVSFGNSFCFWQPDITAPGVNILAAWSAAVPVFLEDLDATKPVFSDFNIISGTSMACPHATGAAAYVKSIHPDWSPAAIKSALMTTGKSKGKKKQERKKIHTSVRDLLPAKRKISIPRGCSKLCDLLLLPAKSVDNEKKPLKDFDGSDATPFAFGAGQISPLDAANPGLVYDTSVEEYLLHLCASGYNATQIAVISGRTVRCPESPGAPKLNYPSVTIPELKNQTSVVRTVTNVGAPKSVYRAIGSPPLGIELIVSPGTLAFNATGQKIAYTLTFVPLQNLSKKWAFGELIWTSDSISVRSPLAVKG